LVDTLSTQTVLSCLGTTSAASTDQCKAEQKEVFTDFVLSTLPDYPGTDPAPAPQASDPQYLASASPVTWVQYAASDGSQRSFRFLSGPWLADRAGSNGNGVPALSIRYCTGACAGTDVSKKQSWIVRRIG